MLSPTESHAPIEIEVLRSASVESRHLVDAIVLDHRGQIVESYGDNRQPMFPRSMIKPIQALPFVLSGAHFQAPDIHKAIAIACASHASAHLHIDFLQAWHQKLGLETESILACGPQRPDDETVDFEMIRAFQAPRRMNNNCSGKHTGMITTALARGIDPRGYEKYDHPIQVEIRRHLSRHSGIDHAKVSWGIDGCGIPTYAIPQENIARMMSAMHSETEGMKEIRDACAKEPYMVGGRGWVCSETNAATGGRIFAKVGAEGNYAAVIYDQGKTIVLKSRDGAFRATEVAFATLLEKHGALKSEEREKIRALASPELKNWSGTPVGSYRVKI